MSALQLDISGAIDTKRMSESGSEGLSSYTALEEDNAIVSTAT